MNTAVLDNNIRDKIERHRAFWNGAAVDAPLVGILQQGWMPLKEAGAADAIWETAVLTPDRLHPRDFLDDYRRIIDEGEAVDDDLVRAVQPFPSIPWLESVMGCPVRCAKPNIWAQSVAETAADLPRIAFDPENPWVRKYMEFLDVLTGLPEGGPRSAIAATAKVGGEASAGSGRTVAAALCAAPPTCAPHSGAATGEAGAGPDSSASYRCPVGASILRGPADLLAAALGDQQAALAYIDEPERTRAFLKQAADLFAAFVEHQWDHMPPFHGGHILPQYDIWAPGRTVRLQEDASALLSPDLYEAFLAEHDERLSGLAEFSVFHLHTSSRFILPGLLKMPALKAVQLSKDDGFGHVEKLLPDLQSVQRAGKRLILRGRFDNGELQHLRQELSPVGLCVQCIVESVAEGEERIEVLKR